MRLKSFISRSLKIKLIFASCLMSVIPMLVFLNYVYPSAFPVLKTSIFIVIVLLVVIAFLGFFTVKDIIDHFIRLSTDAKIIAHGDFEHRIEIDRKDEIGELSIALNQLTRRIKDNMEELKNYGEKTSQINIEINKRVVVLSNLLQISSLISQGAELNEILNLGISKVRQLGHSDLAFLLLVDDDTLIVKAAEGGNLSKLSSIKIKLDEGNLGKMFAQKQEIIFDQRNQEHAGREYQLFIEQFGVKNAICFSFLVRGRLGGVIGIGNNLSDFTYRDDDKEFLDILTKQIVIAIENDKLIHKVEKLEIRDTLTGLYNETFIRERLSEEIKRAVAYHRPCSFILLDVDRFKQYYADFGQLTAEVALKKIASLLKEMVSEIDKAGRFGDNQFAIIVPEKSKKQIVEMAEEIRKRVEGLFQEESDSRKKLTVSGGVSENPLDGTTAEELLNRAGALLMGAKAEGRNRIKAS